MKKQNGKYRNEILRIGHRQEHDNTWKNGMQSERWKQENIMDICMCVGSPTKAAHPAFSSKKASGHMPLLFPVCFDRERGGRRWTRPSTFNSGKWTIGRSFFFRMRGLRALSAGFISVGSKLAIEFVFAWLPVSKVTNFLHVAPFDGKACSRWG